MPAIKITLKSDLCAASGQGFSGEIDTDICYDRYGFPYIGARRLKGCLREAAEYIGCKNIDQIFGVTGSDKSGALKLSNAVLPGYDAMCGELDTVKPEISPQKIIELYTYTKAETEIEGDHAKDNSLRFTRVVKHYSPFCRDDETVFYAECECGEYADDMKTICRALRNIGFKRSRGLGAIKCEYAGDENEKYESQTEIDTDLKYRIQYTVKLTDTLMLSSNSDDESCQHISGTVVLGALAGLYLKTGNAGDPMFEDLFLSGKAIYSNLYISDKTGIETFPAPMFLYKIKSENSDTDGKIIHCFDPDPKYNKLTKNPLKEKYTCSGFRVKNVQTETVYHHSRMGDMLYTQTCISAGQYFTGSVICRGSCVNTVMNLLNSGDLRFGKSKTAQYSKCRVIRCSAEPYRNKTLKIEADIIVLALESDLILTDEYGSNSVDTGVLCSEFGITADKLEPETVLQYKTINGYNAKWNLRKPSVRAFARGSVIVYKAENPLEFDEILYKGEKTGEGFGRVRVYKVKDIKITAECEDTAKGKSETPNLSGIITKINEQKELEDVKLAAAAFAKENEGYFSEEKLNSAFTGRILLMADQAKTFEDFKKRVDSVRSDEKRESVKTLYRGTPEKYWREYLRIIFMLGKYYIKEDIKETEK